MSERINEDELKEKIKNMNNKIEEYYKKEAKTSLNKQVIRGHVPAMGEKFEKEFADILSDVLGEEYRLYVDFTLEGTRPDLIITKLENKEKQKVVALMELKANLGYCRNFNKDLKNEIIKKLERLQSNGESIIKCTRPISFFGKTGIGYLDTDIAEKREHKRSDDPNYEAKIKIQNNNQLKFALISLTKSNITATKFNKFKTDFYDSDIIEKSSGELFCLFTNWYDKLEPNENEIKRLCNFINSIE